MLPVITNIHFTDSNLDRRFGTVIHIKGDAPPGQARGRNAMDYWKQGKKLGSGSLVATITKRPGQPAEASLAIVAFCESIHCWWRRRWLIPAAPAGPSFLPRNRDDRDEPNYRRSDQHTLHFGISFIESQHAFDAASALRKTQHAEGEIKILVESPILWEAVRPFLEALQKIDPIRLSMVDYVRQAVPLKTDIGAPAYSLQPGFKWRLGTLLKQPGAAIDAFTMDPRDEDSIKMARLRLAEEGKLDPRCVMVCPASCIHLRGRSADRAVNRMR